MIPSVYYLSVTHAASLVRQGMTRDEAARVAANGIFIHEEALRRYLDEYLPGTDKPMVVHGVRMKTKFK